MLTSMICYVDDHDTCVMCSSYLGADPQICKGEAP